MDGSRDDFRERLLSAEGRDPAARERYEKEVRMIFEQKLGGVRKWMIAGTMVLGILFAVGFGTVAVLAPAGFPLLARLGFVLGAVFGAAWAALTAGILKKGVFDLRRHSKAMAGLQWGFVVALVTLLMLLAGQAPDKVVGVSMVVNGTVFLIGGAAFLILTRIEQAELNTKEKLLELQYRLAGIEEELKKKR